MLTKTRSAQCRLLSAITFREAQMTKKILFIITVLLAATVSYAVVTNKPESHNSAWIALHGKQANINSKECYECHAERLECITCHEDSKPRSHTLSWVNKTHGLEAKWGRSNCKACHKEDSCVSCHESTKPSSHTSHYQDVHCNVGCQQPIGTWKNTVSKDCIVCHTRRPTPMHPRPY